MLTLVFLLIFIPVERLATREANLVRPRTTSAARLGTDKLCPASAVGRVGHLCQGTTEATGLLLIAQSAIGRLLSCKDMMPLCASSGRQTSRDPMSEGWLWGGGIQPSTFLF